VKFPNWALPVIVIVFVAVRIFIASRFRRAEREKSGKGWFESVPISIKAFWIVLGIAVVALLFWNPKKPISVTPNQSTDPTPASGTPPAAQESRHP
jgi:heme/copper-type cytochrome/quinol oxidase subunit 2